MAPAEDSSALGYDLGWYESAEGSNCIIFLIFLEFTDKNNDGRFQLTPDKETNEIKIDRDIIVLSTPEVAKLAPWVIALVAAGGLAAALSTASGLLLVISSSIAHDVYYRMIDPGAPESRRLIVGRMMVGFSIAIAGYFGVNPPGFVAQVVAFAFGLAASTIFPALFMGIFYKRLNKQGAIAGMLSGLISTSSYIIYFKFISPDLNNSNNWLFGISPEGFGFLGMIINFTIALIVSNFYSRPPNEIYQMIDDIRKP